ncbi:hypothetical protein AHAS_Ahas17G0091900 [Arachis hypogaea]
MSGLELVAGRISILNVVLRVGSRYSRFTYLPSLPVSLILALPNPLLNSFHSLRWYHCSTHCILFYHTSLDCKNVAIFPILMNHVKPQSLDEAVDSFTRMLFMRRPPSIIQFTKILGSLVKTNHCPTAISLLQQLQSRVITPNLFTLNILINCCRGMVWITLAVSAFAKIFKSDFQPYIVTLTTIIKGHNSKESPNGMENEIRLIGKERKPEFGEQCSAKKFLYLDNAFFQRSIRPILKNWI